MTADSVKELLPCPFCGSTDITDGRFLVGQQAREIAELRHDIDRLIVVANEEANNALSAERERDSLKARLAECERDAGRYRILRSLKHGVYWDGMPSSVQDWINGGDVMREDKLDAVIDALKQRE